MKTLILFVIVIFCLVVAIVLLNGARIQNTITTQESASVDGTSFLSEVYSNDELGYSLRIPKGYRIESEGKYSVRILPDVDVVGVGPANYVYISVVVPAMRSAVGEVYNYNPSQFTKLIALDRVGDTTDVSAQDGNSMKQWFTYTLVSYDDVDTQRAKNFQNMKPWEFPEGTTENRFIFEANTNVYIIGYYTGGDSTHIEAQVDPRVTYAMVKSFRTGNSMNR